MRRTNGGSRIARTHLTRLSAWLAAVIALGAILSGCSVSTDGAAHPEAAGAQSTESGGAAESGPRMISVVAVDTAGNPVNGYSLGGGGDSFTATDIRYCSHALGATTDGVYRCGTTAQSANACWPSPGRLLCTPDPWTTRLTAYGYSGSLPVLGQPDPDIFPWALELADGARCVARNGGAWPMPPAGFEFGYSCRSGSVYSFVFYRPQLGTGVGALFDKSQSDWTVFHGDGESAPAPIGVSTVFYSAAAR